MLPKKTRNKPPFAQLLRPRNPGGPALEVNCRALGCEVGGGAWPTFGVSRTIHSTSSSMMSSCLRFRSGGRQDAQVLCFLVFWHFLVWGLRRDFWGSLGGVCCQCSPVEKAACSAFIRPCGSILPSSRKPVDSVLTVNHAMALVKCRGREKKH